MLTFMPSTVIQTKTVSTASASVAAGPFLFGRFFPLPPQSAYIPTVSTSTALSVTGVICIVGLVAGTLFALSMVLADDKVARKVLHVILLSQNDYQWLQAKIAESSKKLAIATPKIGIVEDLRPNAFTIGYGRNSTIVFSMGLFNILSKEELVAVASHELAHIKNNDFFFKTLSNALTTVSFFNPFSYIASSTAQREREMFADERAIELLEKPSALGNALAKICRTIQTLPKESVLVNFSSNLMVASSVLHRVGILSTHPRLDVRLKRISASRLKSSHWGHKNKQFVFFLSLLLVASAVAVSLAMVDLQVNFTANFAASQSLKALPADLKLTSYDMSSGNATWFASPAMMPFNSAQNMHELVNLPYLGASNGNIYVETGNTSSLNSQGNSIVLLVVVTTQNSTYACVRPPISAPGTLWIG
jgi:Zn-dependent protease with chaperone function